MSVIGPSTAVKRRNG